MPDQVIDRAFLFLSETAYPYWDGAVPLILIQLGEMVFGGIGTGLYNMLILPAWLFLSPVP